jgi:transposase-like protein
MPVVRRKFDQGFREGVRIVRETGKPIAEIARELGSVPAPWVTGWPRTALNTKVPKGFPPTMWAS